MKKSDLHVELLDTTRLNQLDSYIETIQDPVGSLINVLHRAQHIFGYIPRELQLYIARKLNIGAAKVNGVVSFYSYFSEEKTGKYLISVCMGTACYVKGAEEIVKTFLRELDVDKHEVTDDELFSVRDVRCVGACGLAPVVTVGEKVYGHVTPDDVAKIIKDFRGDKVC
ncbi:NAD(P)H-dependent oxidoreductase subunit E [Candidatus Xianfuyuplasma coldseepsis]